MGSVVWSADTLIVSYLQPSIFAYNNQKYQEAAILIDSLNNFFLGFGVGIKDLPNPLDNKKVLNREFNADTYSKKWFDMYFPLVSKCMGIYLRDTLDTIKIERGNF
jgi:hypothetical protein